MRPNHLIFFNFFFFWTFIGIGCNLPEDVRTKLIESLTVHIDSDATATQFVEAITKQAYAAPEISIIPKANEKNCCVCKKKIEKVLECVRKRNKTKRDR